MTNTSNSDSDRSGSLKDDDADQTLDADPTRAEPANLQKTDQEDSEPITKLIDGQAIIYDNNETEEAEEQQQPIPSNRCLADV